MKKTYLSKVLTIAIAAALLPSCDSENLEAPPPMQESSSHVIPVEDAINNLYAFLESGVNSRGEADTRQVAEIHTIKSGIKSRGGEEDLPDKILYVTNFQDNQGYAVLAADDRIEAPIIAIGDEGNIAPEDFIAIQNISGSRPYFPDFPSSGPEYFYHPDYPDELVMNPNTVNLQFAENEYPIGNYSARRYYPSNNNLSDDAYTNIKTPIIGTLCLNYATGQIEKAIKTSDDDSGYLAQNPDGTTGGAGVKTTIKSGDPTWSDVCGEKSVDKLINKFRQWNQQEPFNNLFPKRFKFKEFKIVNAPAGCFPIAVAKIAAYLQLNYSHWGQFWKYLTQKDNSYKVGHGPNYAAGLLWIIAEGCNCWYFGDGTFTIPWSTTDYLNEIGFINAECHKYSFDSVKQLLDNNQPVILFGIPEAFGCIDYINIFDSHAWVADGYKKMQRTTKYEKWAGNVCISNWTKVETFDMIHCDYGWGGNSNGYYVSGVFDLALENKERQLDGLPSDTESKYTQVWYINYEKP